MVNKGQLSIGLRLEAWIWTIPVGGQWIPAKVIDLREWAVDEFVIIRIQYPDSREYYSLRRHTSNLRLLKTERNQA